MLSEPAFCDPGGVVSEAVGDLVYLTVDVDGGYRRKVLANDVALLDADCQPKFISGVGELADTVAGGLPQCVMAELRRQQTASP